MVADPGPGRLTCALALAKRRIMGLLPDGRRFSKGVSQPRTARHQGLIAVGRVTRVGSECSAVLLSQGRNVLERGSGHGRYGHGLELLQLLLRSQ